MRSIPDNQIFVFKTLGLMLIDTKDRDTQIAILAQLQDIISKYRKLPEVNDASPSALPYEDIIYKIIYSVEINDWEATLVWIYRIDSIYNIFNYDHDKLQWWELGELPLLIGG